MLVLLIVAKTDGLLIELTLHCCSSYCRPNTNPNPSAVVGNLSRTTPSLERLDWDKSTSKLCHISSLKYNSLHSDRVWHTMRSEHMVGYQVRSFTANGRLSSISDRISHVCNRNAQASLSNGDTAKVL